MPDQIELNMAAVWCRCVTLLLAFNIAVTSAGTGRIIGFTVTGGLASQSGAYVQLDAQSNITLNCTAENVTSNTILRFRKDTSPTATEISANEDFDERFRDTARFTGLQLVQGPTPDVKYYMLQVRDLADTDTSNYSCYIASRNSLSVFLNVSGVPHYRCNNTIKVDRKSGSLSIECPLYAYHLRSVAAYWTNSMQQQPSNPIRVNVTSGSRGGDEITKTETPQNVSYTLRLVLADTDKGIPNKVILTISNIERVTDFFKTQYHLTASGEKGDADHVITVQGSATPVPVRGAAMKAQSWSLSALLASAVLGWVVVIFGHLQ